MKLNFRVVLRKTIRTVKLATFFAFNLAVASKILLHTAQLALFHVETLQILKPISITLSYPAEEKQTQP